MANQFAEGADLGREPRNVEVDWPNLDWQHIRTTMEEPGILVVELNRPAQVARGTPRRHRAMRACACTICEGPSHLHLGRA